MWYFKVDECTKYIMFMIHFERQILGLPNRRFAAFGSLSCDNVNFDLPE